MSEKVAYFPICTQDFIHNWYTSWFLVKIHCLYVSPWAGYGLFYEIVFMFLNNYLYDQWRVSVYNKNFKRLLILPHTKGLSLNITYICLVFYSSEDLLTDLQPLSNSINLNQKKLASKWENMAVCFLYYKENMNSMLCLLVIIFLSY